jgi:predicted nucleic acid-binding protein
MIRIAPWIEHSTVTNQPLVSTLRLDLDPGEAEAIACALENQATLLLIDERRGGRAAQQLGIPIMGLIGVLLMARKQQLIPHIRPHLDALRNVAGFWISTALYDRVLHDVGEDVA